MSYFTSRSKLTRLLSSQDSTPSSDKKRKQTQKIVTLSISTIDQTMEIYRWRSETQFPIAKVKSIQLLPLDLTNTLNPQTQKALVTFQQLSNAFAELTDIPLFKILYLVKQALIGLERLFNKFGSFNFTKEMIFIDQVGKCKVWINRQIQLNTYSAFPLSQAEFVNKVYQIFQHKTMETKQSLQFYSNIKNTNSFFSALQYLQSFVQKQKIKLISFFRINPSSNGTTSLQKKKKKLDLNMIMSKKPHFLTNLQSNSSKEQSLTNSKKQIYQSVKFLPKTFLSKPQMKISNDTAADSLKNIKSSNEYHSPNFKSFSTKIIKDTDLFNSQRRQKIPKFQATRKFSNNTRNQYSPTIQIHQAQIKFPAPQYQITKQISQSMTFCEIMQDKSRSSSVDNKEKLIQKKKEVFNVNGWQLKVNSLFSNNQQFKKSFCEKNESTTIKRQPVRLDLLDKCTTNLCESFMQDATDNS